MQARHRRKSPSARLETGREGNRQPPRAKVSPRLAPQAARAIHRQPRVERLLQKGQACRMDASGNGQECAPPQPSPPCERQ